MQQGRGRLFVWRLTGLTTACAALAVVAWCAGIRYNGTESFPCGFWRLERGPATKGDLVFFAPPADNLTVQWGRSTGILHWRFGGLTPMLKRIVAVQGDTVNLGANVTVNGVPIAHSRIFTRDPGNREIPSTAEAGVVPAGRVWLMSDFADASFDSRYFGHVAVSSIEGTAVPVWVW